MRGIGWVILFQDPATDRLTNHWITLHQDGVPAGFKPLLVMDVWEHAFMRDYKATEKAKYVEAFFRNIDWQTVDRRLQEHSARPSGRGRVSVPTSTSAAMASAVAALGLLLLAGCSLAGRTVGTFVDDKALIAAVKIKVVGEHPSHIKRVNVDAYEGTVYLSGFVERPIEKSDAEIAARRTEGVKQVVNDIVVRGSEQAVAAAPAAPAADPSTPDDPGRDPGGAGVGPADPTTPSTRTGEWWPRSTRCRRRT